MTVISGLGDLASIEPTKIWADVIARIVEGERITLAVVEIPPGGVVPEHRHHNEQLGLCLRGSVTFRIGDESRELRPGGTWRILADVPHEVVAGPEGAVCLDVFTPVRDDWSALDQVAPAVPRWPAQDA